MNKVTTQHAMSPEALAACRQHLARQWENGCVDAALLQRAWDTAYQAAAMLYQDFGARQVVVFGSLTERGWFTEFSDIDIAVRGLSEDAYFDAQAKIDGISAEFKFDLVDFADASGAFLDRMLKQAIPIEKGETNPHRYCATSVGKEEIYEMNRSKLTQRIGDELGKIERTIGSITEAMGELDIVAVRHRKFLEHSIAENLAKVYHNIERIFERIAREIDRDVPSGAEWHKALLAQMAEPRAQRPPVISPKTRRRLKRLLKFRHRVNNIYAEELVYEQTEKHAKRVGKLFQNVCDDLGRFTDALARDEAGP